VPLSDGRQFYRQLGDAPNQWIRSGIASPRGCRCAGFSSPPL
jgi:hypothetical protein